MIKNHFGFPSSDDNFSSALDKSAGFASDTGAGFASDGAVALAIVSSFLSSIFGAAGVGVVMGCAAGCGSDSFSRTFSPAGRLSAPARKFASRRRSEADPAMRSVEQGR